MIPDGWHKVRVGDFAKVLRGASPRPKGDPRYYGGDVPRLMVADITRDKKYITPRIDFLTKEGAKLSRPMPAGTFVIVCSGTVGVPGILAVDACIHDGFLALDNIADDVSSEYLFYLFSSIQHIFNRSATHGGVFINLTTEILREFTITLPPINEQNSIALILSKSDEQISIMETIINRKRALKNALMQQLLIGKKRFKEFGKSASNGNLPKEWGNKEIKELFKIIKRKNTRRITHVLTASGEHGLVDQREYFNRSVAGENLDNYYLLKRGEFAYNRSSMIGYPYGAIKRLDQYDEGILSTLYICFNVDNADVDSDFYMHLFESGYLNKALRSIAQVGARAHGLLNITLSDFMKIRVPMPTKEEQVKIAAILNACDDEIKLLEDQLTALQTQKRGLMQKLLTGKIRVKV